MLRKILIAAPVILAALALVSGIHVFAQAAPAAPPASGANPAAEPAKPDQPAPAAAPGNPAQPADPIDEPVPAAPAKPAEPAKAEPAKPAKPAEPAAPAVTEAPKDPIARLKWLAEGTKVKGSVQSGGQRIVRLELPDGVKISAKPGFELPKMGIKVDRFVEEGLILKLIDPVPGADPASMEALVKM